MSHNIAISFITDSNYAMQTSVAITSLIENKKVHTQCDIFILTMELNEKSIAKLNSLNTKNVRINIIKAQNPSMKVKNNFVANYSDAIFLKYEIPNLIKNYDKVLYLDADIIINKDLQELYSTDLNEFYLAGVRDIEPTLLYKKNNKSFENYFNSGILLLNTKKMRENDFTNKITEFYNKKGSEFKYPDQDAFNYMCNAKIISYKYNYLTSNKLYLNTQLKNFHKENLRDEDIVILHYAGFKPWVYKNVFFAKQWEKYYQKSPYSNEKLNRSGKFSFVYKLYLFARKQYELINEKIIL